MFKPERPVYVLGSGPSLKSLNNDSLSGGFVVAINEAIFLTGINPDVISFEARKSITHRALVASRIKELMSKTGISVIRKLPNKLDHLEKTSPFTVSKLNKMRLYATIGVPLNGSIEVELARFLDNQVKPFRFPPDPHFTLGRLIPLIWSFGARDVRLAGVDLFSGASFLGRKDEGQIPSPISTVSASNMHPTQGHSRRFRASSYLETLANVGSSRGFSLTTQASSGSPSFLDSW